MSPTSQDNSSTEQSKPKWTPGPYEVAERNAYFGVYTSPAHYSAPRLVAACAKPHDDAKTNANLFAAAPELYEALRKLRQECVDVMLGTRPSVTISMLHDSEIALAKARGETE